MFENPVSLILTLVALNLPLYWVLVRILFGGAEGFLEAIRYALTPDLLSMFFGELGSDWSAEIKLGLFGLISTGAVWGEYLLLAPILLIG